MTDLRYRDLNSYLRERFGCRVQKVSLDAGLTCPNRDGTKGRGGCIYCNARGSGTGRYREEPDLRKQLEEGIRFYRKRYRAAKFLAYFQSFSNTYAPLSVLKRLYRQVLDHPDVVGLCIGTRPDCVEDETLDFIADLARSRMVWIEYGLQSASDETLRLLQRGHTVADFRDAVERTRARGILTCAHVILGLPGEGREAARNTARLCASLHMEGIKFHHLYVLRGTPLEAAYRAGRYRPISSGEYVERLVDALEELPPEMVIQRLTGDPDPRELVAPAWSLKKHEIRTRIQQRLKERNTRQGARFTKEARRTVQKTACR